MCRSVLDFEHCHESQIFDGAKEVGSGSYKVLLDFLTAAFCHCHTSRILFECWQVTSADNRNDGAPIGGCNTSHTSIPTLTTTFSSGTLPPAHCPLVALLVQVMTTEILRSMFYKGSEVMREVAWIVMDEVHYLRDRERGVVWEESIVMAPKNARFVFLSATVPNAREFADWVAKVWQVLAMSNQYCGICWIESQVERSCALGATTDSAREHPQSELLSRIS